MATWTVSVAVKLRGPGIFNVAAVKVSDGAYSTIADRLLEIRPPTQQGAGGPGTTASAR
jgi:hypothetical protein